MIKRRSLPILIASQMLAFAAVASAGTAATVDFNGGPGCGTVKGSYEFMRKAAVLSSVGYNGEHLSVVSGSIVIADQGSDADLQAAKTELEGLMAKINEKLKSTDTPPAQLVELYQWRDKVSNALERVNKAIAAAAADPAKAERQAKLDSLMGQAAFINKVLASYLGVSDNGNTIHMKDQAFQLEVGADAIVETVRKRLPFLGGAVQGRIRINPGAEMVSQFNALKAEFYTVLLDAAQTMKDMGKKPTDDKRLSGMAQWGNATKVIYPGQGWQDAFHRGEILTSDQRSSILN